MIPTMLIHSHRGIFKTRRWSSRQQTIKSFYSTSTLLRCRTLVAIQWNVRGQVYLPATNDCRTINHSTLSLIQTIQIGTPSDSKTFAVYSLDAAHRNLNTYIPPLHLMKPVGIDADLPRLLLLFFALPSHPFLNILWLSTHDKL